MKILIGLLWVCSLLSATTYRIGPTQQYKTFKALAQGLGQTTATVITLAPGDEVLVDPGEYREAVYWRGGSVTGAPAIIRGTGTQRTVIDGTGISLSGSGGIPRALFQVEGANFEVSNFELRNGRNGQNGAGARVIGATSGTTPHKVKFSNMLIRWNDMGIMSSQLNDVVVEHSEIAWNGTPLYNGYSHNVYMDGFRLTVRGCLIHNATNGQNLHIRSKYVEVLYNYVDTAHDRIDGGDTTKEVGIQEGAYTAQSNSNAVLIGNIFIKRGTGYSFLDFGPEGSTPARNGTLFLINNLFIRETNVPHWFFRMGHAAERAEFYNNTFWSDVTTVFGRGPGNVNMPDGMVSGSSNWFAKGTIVPNGLTNSIFGSTAGADPGFMNRAGRDYRLRHDSLLLDAGTSNVRWVDGDGVEHKELPTSTYLAHMQIGPRVYAGNPDIGPFELAPENRLLSTDSISGKVLLPNGKPSVGHSVVLSGPDPRSVITGADGKYTFLNVNGAELSTAKPWDSDITSKKVQTFISDFITAPAYTVRGTVTSIAKNEPVSGVGVYLNGRDSRWTVTGPDGGFQFPSPLIPGGTINTLVLQHSSITRPEDVSRVLPPLNADLDLPLKVELNYSLSVSVRDAVNGTVIAVPLELTGTGLVSPVIAASNTRGNWTFPNLKVGGTYKIRVTQTPHLFTPSEINVADLQSNLSFQINTPKMINMTGVVRFKNGNPIPGARVTSTGTQVYAFTADSAGRYLCNFCLPGGTYNLTATSSLAVFPAVAATVPALSATQGDIDVVGTGTFTITAIVKLASGAALTGIPVRLRGTSSIDGSPIVKDFNSGTGGLVTFTGIPEGSTVRVYPDRPASYTFSPAFEEFVVTGARTLTFEATAIQ